MQTENCSVQNEPRLTACFHRPRSGGPTGGRLLNRLLILVALLAASPIAAAGDWIRPGLNTNQPVWGIRGGLLWAVAPAGFRAGEPRGLIRLGYPVLPEKRYDLVNFIAIEPIVRGQRGFSELERSQLRFNWWIPQEAFASPPMARPTRGSGCRANTSRSRHSSCPGL